MLRGLGIRSRLLGLVLVPAMGLIGLGIQEVDEHRRLAHDANELARDVDAAAIALDAVVVTTQEFRHSQTLVQARNFGVPAHQVEALLGYDPAAELTVARDRVDANPLIPTLEARSDTTVGLEAARAAMDRTATDQQTIALLSVEARQAWQHELEVLAVTGVEAPAEAGLRRALAALQAVAELFELSNERIAAVANVLVPGSASELASTGSGPLVVNERYEAALEEVALHADEHLVPPLEVVSEDRRFAEAMERMLAAENPLADIPALAAMFRAGLEQDDDLRPLVAHASEDAREHALRVGASAQRSYERTVLAVVGMLLLSFGFALAAAHSIARPLRRVARRATAISGGDLDGAMLPEHGPRETAVLARTLNDAVVNLRAVASRMAALAAGDLEGARRTTPGRLGELVGRSVDGLAESLTERDRLQRRLVHDAAHDPLTGLANRRTTIRRLDALLDTGSQVGLLYLDLDGFKLVNDEFGHGVGDRLLIVAARRLGQAATEDVLVSRLGGDEFVVGTVASSQDGVLELAETVLHSFDEPITIDGIPHRIGVSVGVAFSVPDDDADHLLRSADNALYAAKAEGRGGVVVLDAELRARVAENHRIEADLRTAIDGGELELYYQPVFEADGGGLHGVEALVRWPQQGGGMVAPDAFIPIAERSGLVVDLDRWVLRRGLEQLRSWHDGPLGSLRLSVNVSARTLLASTFVDDVRYALVDNGIVGEALVVEVTETALLHDLETAAAHIAALRELGVRTSVDDFGTGYTSVSHLRRLPVSEVKIDRSFIQAMGTDERDRVLVDLVVRMGTVLGLDVVAEGVETEEQLDALRLLGCRFAQGFLLGRPEPADEFLALHGAAGRACDTRRNGRAVPGAAVS